jgi:tRNA 5-methylaminomethyl-2-thiouridine biosynthesis bifunctional protein
MRAMKKPVYPHLPADLQQADLSWQADGAPYSAQYGDVYFSRNGGLAETAHVFLEGNSLQQRWLELDQQDHPGVFTIAELGFGTGLNFLSCWRLWQQTGCKRLRLHFISCEKHPMSRQALTRALQQWPELNDVSPALISQYPDHSQGYHRLLFMDAIGDQHSPVTLDLYYGDALAMLQQQSSPGAKTDAWFLDGFSPKLNPELWSDDLLQTIAGLCKSGTTLSSYSVTGRVVRALKALDFVVEKRKGFGPKRQMLFARYSPQPELTSIPPNHFQRKTAIVIGAGLAGASVARSLAQRGVQVTVLDQANSIASGASGNRQAVVQLRLNKQLDTHCQFHIHSYLYALRFYEHISAVANNGFEWHGCGVLTLNSAYTHTREAADSTILAETYSHYPAVVLEAINASQAQAITGLAIQEDGLWQAAGGWMNPRLCCEACLDHTLIQVETGIHVGSLEQTENGWIVHTDKQTWKADHVIVANSYSARDFEQTALYPVSPLRGQVSHAPANTASATLKQVVCSQRYLAPADADGQHCIGASYIKNATNTDLSAAEHAENLEKLGALAELVYLNADLPLAGRAGVRGASQDYTPIAGQVPDTNLPEWRYGGAQHQNSDNKEVNRLPGLYITSGHGSHGTVSCPIIAEHIAALICDEASPLPQAMADVIDPVRFVHRLRRRLKLPS